MVGLDRVKPRGAQLWKDRRYVLANADRMCQRRDPSGVADMLHGFAELRLVPRYVALGRFVQIIVERLLHAAYVAFLDQQLREMRATRHPPAARLHLLERNVHAQFPQAGDQPDIAIAARGLHASDPRSKIAQVISAYE